MLRASASTNTNPGGPAPPVFEPGALKAAVESMCNSVDHVRPSSGPGAKRETLDQLRGNRCRQPVSGGPRRILAHIEGV